VRPSPRGRFTAAASVSFADLALVFWNYGFLCGMLRCRVGDENLPRGEGLGAVIEIF